MSFCGWSGEKYKNHFADGMFNNLCVYFYTLLMVTCVFAHFVHYSDYTSIFVQKRLVKDQVKDMLVIVEYNLNLSCQRCAVI